MSQCPDCGRPQGSNFDSWLELPISERDELCFREIGRALGSTEMRDESMMDCNKVELGKLRAEVEALRSEVADYVLIKNEPVVIGRIAVIKLAAERARRGSQ